MFYSSLFLKPTVVETAKSTYLCIPGYKNRLTTEQIIWIQGEGNYSRVHLTNGKQLMVAQTLSKFELLIPAFIRTHKSSIVNPNHIQTLRAIPSQKTGLLVLTGGIELIVARRRFDTVSEMLNEPQVA